MWCVAHHRDHNVPTLAGGDDLHLLPGLLCDAAEREVLRPGVLWFLRNLNDQNFHPIQEVATAVRWNIFFYRTPLYTGHFVLTSE